MGPCRLISSSGEMLWASTVSFSESSPVVFQPLIKAIGDTSGSVANYLLHASCVEAEIKAGRKALGMSICDHDMEKWSVRHLRMRVLFNNLLV